MTVGIGHRGRETLIAKGDNAAVRGLAGQGTVEDIIGDRGPLGRITLEIWSGYPVFATELIIFGILVDYGVIESEGDFTDFPSEHIKICRFRSLFLVVDRRNIKNGVIRAGRPFITAPFTY